MTRSKFLIRATAPVLQLHELLEQKRSWLILILGRCAAAIDIDRLEGASLISGDDIMLCRTVVPLLIAAGIAMPALAEPGAMGEPKMLIHGNYCGPGNNAPLPPIDALDAACARHDACTPNGTMPSRVCNARLEREADAISRDPKQLANVRAMAGFVAAGAAMLQIADEPDMARPQARRAARQ